MSKRRGSPRGRRKQVLTERRTDAVERHQDERKELHRLNRQKRHASSDKVSEVLPLNASESMDQSPPPCEPKKSAINSSAESSEASAADAGRTPSNAVKKSSSDGSVAFCLLCSKVLEKAREFDNHLKMHASEDPARCLLCGKIFKYRRCLGRHLTVEHKISEPLQAAAVLVGTRKRKLLEVDGGNRAYECDEEAEDGDGGDDEDAEDDSTRRIRQGFLPENGMSGLPFREALQNQKVKKVVLLPKGFRLQGCEQLRAVGLRDDFVRLSPSNASDLVGHHNGSRSNCNDDGSDHHAAAKGADSGRHLLFGGDGGSPSSFKCYACNCVFDSGRSLQDHQRTVHESSSGFGATVPNADDGDGVGRSSEEDRFHELEGDGDDIAVQGPSENIVSEPDFEAIKGAMKGGGFVARSSFNVAAVAGRWGDVLHTGYEDGACQYEDDNEVEVFCVASLKDSGGKEADVVKYKVNLRSEEVLVTRVVGLNTSTGEKSYLYKCHWCAKVFLSLDKLQEHLGSHLPKSQKTFMCYNCGQLFSHRAQFRAHLSEYHNVDVDRGGGGGGAVSDTPPPGRSRRTTSVKCELPEAPASESNGSHSAVEFEALTVKTEDDRAVAAGAAGVSDNDLSPLSPSDAAPPSVVVASDGTRVGYQCRFCSKVFDRLFSLNRHMRSHTGVKPCYCNVCGKGFSESRNLRHHMIRFHSDGSERHLLRRYRNYQNVKRRGQSVSVAGGCDDKGGGGGRDDFKRSRVVSNLSCSELSTELGSPQEENGPEGGDGSGGGAHEEGVLMKALRPSDGASRSDVWRRTGGGGGGGGGERLDFSSSVDGGTSPVICPPLLEDCCGSKPGECCYDKRTLDQMFSEELRILADTKQSLMGTFRRQRRLQRSNSNNALRRPMESEASLSPSTPPPVLTEVDSSCTDSVDSGTCHLSDDLDSLKLMSSVASLILPLSPTTVAADSSTDAMNRKKGANNTNYFSHYYPRLDVVSNPVTRSEVCKPEVLPDGKLVYACCYCRKKFGSISDVNRHMDFHEDVRPYKCELCNYNSRTNSQLKVHMMRHQGIRQHLCETCNYNAVTQSDLNRHKKTKAHRVRGRNMCQLCGLGHFTSQQKSAHMLSYHLGFPLALDDDEDDAGQHLDADNDVASNAGPEEVEEDADEGEAREKEPQARKGSFGRRGVHPKSKATESGGASVEDIEEFCSPSKSKEREPKNGIAVNGKLVDHK